MIQLSHRILEYRQGYIRVQALEQELRERYQKVVSVLQGLYDLEKRWKQAWEEREALFSNQWRRMRLWLLVAWHIALFSTTFLLCGVSLILTGMVANQWGDTLGTWTLSFSCMTILLVFLASMVLVWISFTRPFKTASPPAQENLEQLFQQKPSLVTQWFARIHKEALQDKLPAYVEGTLGEERLLAGLSRWLDNRFLALRNVQIDRSLDIDIVVLAPSGVWLLESKYWQGYIMLSQGAWQHYRRFYLPGRIPSTRKVPIQWEPDKQVLHIERLVKSLLEKEIPNVNWDGYVKGVLVFTHPNARFSIDGTCQVLWGTLPRVIELVSMQVEEPLPYERLFEIADVLLKRERVIQGGLDSQQKYISAVSLGLEIYQEYALLLKTLETKREKLVGA